MIKHFIFSFLFLSSTVFSSPIQLPEILEFSTYGLFGNAPFVTTPGTWPHQLANCAYDLGIAAFNDSPEIGSVLLALQRDYEIETAVETGSLLGSTTMFFINTVKGEVHTIEILDGYYRAVKERFQKYPNVHCHLGSSEKVLNEILPALQNKRVLFYLDAHGYGFFPLLEELKEISKTHRDNCIIVIDDFKVPGRPEISYDGYEEGECSYECIKDNLDLVFTDYSAHYLIPKDYRLRAKFVAIPKNWRNSQ